MSALINDRRRAHDIKQMTPPMTEYFARRYEGVAAIENDYEADESLADSRK
jgi:hypothetical protein